MEDHKNKLSRTALLALFASAAAMTPALAQQTEPERVPDAATCDDNPNTALPACDEDGEAIVVTGSRLRRTEFNSASPVQIVSREGAVLEGISDTADLIQRSAIATGTFQTNNQLTGFVTSGGPGSNQVALRGLGATRTLILLNGRRLGPAGTRGQTQAVDLSTIPGGIVDRVEILTDGASSIYGSEALGGVINIITRKQLDGFEITGSANQISWDGGGEEYSVGAAWGKVFDKGYLNVSAEFYRQEALLTGDRDYLSCQSDYLFNREGGALVDFDDPLTGAPKCYGLFTNVLRATPSTALGSMDLFYAQPGVTYPTLAQGNNSPVAGMVRQGRTGFPETIRYGNFQDPLYQRRTVLSPRDIMSLYITGGYDITSSIEAYTEIMFNQRDSEQDGIRQFFPNVSTANPGAQRPDTGTAFAGTTLLPIISNTSDGDQTVKYGRIVAGLKGDFGKLLDTWSWDFVTQYSMSNAQYSGDFIYNDRVNAVTGASACVQNPVGPLNISNYNCSALSAPIPWTSARILRGEYNQQERDFLFGYETSNTVYEHMYAELFASGELFSLPAGAVEAGIGAHVRSEELDDKPGHNQRNANLWGQTAAGRTQGNDNVKEVFGELSVPVLKGIPAFERLGFDISGRYSDYESYGSSETYKTSINWQITPSWRLRAAKGTSFRAPALFELYLANQTSFLGQASVDPCLSWENNSNPRIQANCAAAGVPAGFTTAGSSSALIVAGGGAGVLKAEEGENRTMGVIWTPSFLDLNIAVDYWEVDVENQIRQFGAGNIVTQCYNSPNFPTDPLCSLFVRASATDPLRPNQIISVQNSYVNVASQTARGLDANIRYVQDASIGRFTFDARAYWTFEDDIQLLGTSTPTDNLGTTYNFRGPDFTGEFNITYRKQDWTVQWSMDFIGKGSDTEQFRGDVFNSTRYTSSCSRSGVVAPCSSYIDPVTGATLSGTSVVAQPVYFKQYNEFTSYHSLGVRKTFDKFEINAGISNIFDELPPSASSGQFRIGTSALNGYDIIGRSFFFGATKRF